MDDSNQIKGRYAKEAETYRKEALLVNFDAKVLFNQLLYVATKLFPNTNEKIRVLDIGAGNGMLTELIMNKYSNAEITMLDFSPEMLESAKAYFESQKLNTKNISYMVSDFISDDFPTGPFDLIISSYALHHIRTEEDLKLVFKKIVNSLKETCGTFICIDMYLGVNQQLRNEQVSIAIDIWTHNFDSIERAYEWGDILRKEDTPATIPTIISLLLECCDNSTPLLTNQSGVIATLYGVTKLSPEKIHALGLSDYIESCKEYSMLKNISQVEHLIAPLPFPNQKVK